jgi:hypothetical protein
MKEMRVRSRPADRGVASLAVTMLLLFVTALALLYVGRGQLFDQKSSINVTQSTQALETAEAGIEWVTGMLNSPYDIGTDCAFLTTANVSFRKKYVMTQWNDATSPNSNIVPAANVYPGCRIGAGGALSCSCPAANGGVASLGTTATPSFTVRLEAIAGDSEAVRVTSWGCSAAGTACSADTAANADANARVSVILKLKPVLRAAPASPLTCGTSCQLGGSANVENGNVATNGVLVNAGTTITAGPGVSLSTLPGQPANNALIGNDASLSALSSSDADCSNSNMFNAYFGSKIEDYRRAPSTKIISCSSAADCKTQLTNAYNDGWRAFYFDSDLHLSGNQALGSTADPVTLVTANAIDINGNWDIYGLIFSNSAAWNDLGTGTATIHGAQISCAAYKNNGNGTLTYDADALKNARNFTALMVRVPGSWKDF